MLKSVLVDAPAEKHARIDSSPEMIALFLANLPGEAAEVADLRSLSQQ